MSLIWHIVANDLRRLRLPLALWAMVIALKLGLGALLLWSDANFTRRSGDMMEIGNWLIGVEVVMGYLLVAAFVQGHVVVGTTAFWMTRPVSGGRLLAAKLLGFAVIFGVVPLALTLPWWLACGYGTREITLATGETLLWQALVVMMALPLATLTDGFLRYLMWSLVVAVAISLVTLMMIIAPAVEKHAVTDRTSLNDVDLLAVRAGLGTLIFFMVGCGAAVHQFLRRRIVRSFAFMGAAIVLALVVVSSSSVSRILRPLTVQVLPLEEAGVVPNGASGGIAKIKLVFQGAESREMPGHDPLLSVGFKVEGLSDELVLSGGIATQRWNWTDGVSVTREGNVSLFREKHVAWWRALGIAPPEPGPREVTFGDAMFRDSMFGRPRIGRDGTGEIVANIPPSFVTRVQRDPPSYWARGNFRLFRPVVVAERPMEVGQVLGRGKDTTRITNLGDAYLTPNGYRSSKPPVDPVSHLVRDSQYLLQIHLAQHRPALRADDGWFTGIGTLLLGHWSESGYFLVNRARGNATLSYYSSSRPMRLATVGIVRQSVLFRAPHEWREGKWVEQTGWFDDRLTLAKMETEEMGWFTKELSVERFDVTGVRPPGGVR